MSAVKTAALGGMAVLVLTLSGAQCAKTDDRALKPLFEVPRYHGADGRLHRGLRRRCQVPAPGRGRATQGRHGGVRRRSRLPPGGGGAPREHRPDHQRRLPGVPVRVPQPGFRSRRPVGPGPQLKPALRGPVFFFAPTFRGPGSVPEGGKPGWAGPGGADSG